MSGTKVTSKTNETLFQKNSRHTFFYKMAILYQWNDLKKPHSGKTISGHINHDRKNMQTMANSVSLCMLKFSKYQDRWSYSVKTKSPQIFILLVNSLC